MNSHVRVLQCVIILASGCWLVPHLFSQDTGAAPPARTAALLSLQKPEGSSEKMLTNYVEIGGEHLSLTNGFGMWQGVYARSVLNAGSEVLSGELDEQHEFGDSGIYCALGETHNFSANTYASITLGSSIGGFFLPFYRGDAFINHKWLARKQLITTLGLGYYAAKDPHRDRSLSAGTTYYFAKPWIVEDGARFNVSNPGGVLSPSGFIAVTQGTNKHHYITARASYGQEAYQIIGPSNILSSFRSQTFTITWRQWIGRNWGTNGVADYYGSPYYTRVGGTLGLFREF